jgi:hypothetical protein
MFIYIPTYKRLDKQPTLNYIPEQLRDRTRLVVDASEIDLYTEKYGKNLVVGMPPSVKGISKTRQWILENSQDKYAMMLDDDMSFAVRREGKLPKCEPQDMVDMYELLSSWLDNGFVHVGMSQRAFNHLEENDYVEIARMNNVYAFNVKKVLDCGARFDRTKLMQDFDMTLTLLEKGFKNRVTYQYCWGQGKSGAPGGCSEYRDLSLMKEVAEHLARLHPGLVHVVQKESAEAWGGGVGNLRWDVNIEWKKAFGRKKHGDGILSFLKK